MKSISIILAIAAAVIFGIGVVYWLLAWRRRLRIPAEGPKALLHSKYFFAAHDGADWVLYRLDLTADRMDADVFHCDSAVQAQQLMDAMSMQLDERAAECGREQEPPPTRPQPRRRAPSPASTEVADALT